MWIKSVAQLGSLAQSLPQMAVISKLCWEGFISFLAQLLLEDVVPYKLLD